MCSPFIHSSRSTDETKITNDVLLLGLFGVQVESGFGQSLLKLGIAGASHNVPDDLVESALHL